MDIAKGDLVYPGLTPLMQAAAQGDVYAVEEALKKGAQVNARNYDDHLTTALHYAILNGSEEVVRMFLTAGNIPILTSKTSRRRFTSPHSGAAPAL